MKQQDKLKKTLRDYYDNQQVPLSDHEWEQASAYLDAVRNKRKKRYALLILLVLVSGFVLLSVFPESSSTDHLQTSLPAKAQMNSVVSSPADVTLELKVKEPNFKKNSSSNASQKTKSCSSTPSITENFVMIQQLPYFEPQEKVQEPHTFEIVPLTTNATQQNNTKKEAPANYSEVVHLPAIIEAVSDTSDNSRTKNKENQILVKEHVEPRPVKPEDPAQGQDLPPLKDEGAVSVLALPKTTETRDLNAIGEKNLTNDTARLETTLQTIAIIPDTLKSGYSDGITISQEDIVADTLSSSLPNNPIVQDGFFYELGAVWTYGWRGRQKSDARGFSPALGINYINRLNNRCAFSFGVQYLQVNNLSNSSKISRVSSYAYGEQSSVTVITPSSLYYILAPLRFHHFVNNKTGFGAGVNLAYLLNVDATVTTYDEKPGFDSNYKTRKQGGYSEGFSWFDSQLAFWYQRRILPSLAIQAEIFIGLTDVKQNEFFGFIQKERNSGAKLSLIYYAFRKNERK